ncbi:MAG: site-2 protease family protein [Candidatus Thorarchaeota archaeon]|nr:site-2 protease family protein [Candidatus Thorarchaeota archaeon]
MDSTVLAFGLIGLFWLIIYALAQYFGVERLKERGIEAGTPFFFMWRTERLNAFLTRMGKKFPLVFFNIGIVVGFGGMIFALFMFGENLIKFFTQPAEAGGVVPIIPGVTITGLPLLYMLIGLAVAILTHEFAHGLAASRDNIGIKSAGLLGFLVLFGAFVEPDEEAFKNNTTPQGRMRMLAAGSFSNIAWSFIFLAILMNFATIASIAYYPPSGAYIYQISEGSPAAETLQVGDVIIGLNDTVIANWSAVSVFMADAPAGAQLTIHTLDGNHTIILAANELNTSKGYIGVFGADYWEPKPGWDLFLDPMFIFHSQQIILWCYIILISLAVFNLLPIPLLDGDGLLSNGLSLLTSDEKKIKIVMYPIRIAAFLIVILSIILSLIMGKGIF